MSEKQLNMRVPEEVIDRFRSFCESEGYSQPEGLQNILELAELSKAKETFGDRGTEIANFQLYLNELLEAFINSVKLNDSAEKRAELQFKELLESKDKQIVSLQEKNDKLKAKAEESKTAQQNLETRVAEVEDALSTANTSAAVAQKAADDKEALLVILKEKLEENDGKLKNYDQMEETLNNKQALIDKLQAEIQENAFNYKSEIASLEQLHNSEKNEIKEKALAEKTAIQEQVLQEKATLQEKYNAEHQNIIKEYENQIKAYTEKIDNYNNKIVDYNEKIKELYDVLSEKDKLIKAYEAKNAKILHEEEQVKIDL